MKRLFAIIAVAAALCMGCICGASPAFADEENADLEAKGTAITNVDQLRAACLRDGSSDGYFYLANDITVTDSEPGTFSIIMVSGNVTIDLNNHWITVDFSRYTQDRLFDCMTKGHLTIDRSMQAPATDGGIRAVGTCTRDFSVFIAGSNNSQVVLRHNVQGFQCKTSGRCSGVVIDSGGTNSRVVIDGAVISDCGSSTGYSAMIYVFSGNSSFEFKSGTIRNCSATYSIICAENKQASVGKDVVIDSCTVHPCSGSYPQAVLTCLQTTADFDGTISNCTVEASAGSLVYAGPSNGSGSSTLSMTGARIGAGCTVSGDKGIVWVGTKSGATIKDGTIANTAKTRSLYVEAQGSAAISNTAFTMSGNAVVERGAFAWSEGTLAVSGCTIDGNGSKANCGGLIYAVRNESATDASYTATLSLDGCTLKNGKAVRNSQGTGGLGGGIYASGVRLELKDTNVTGCAADGYGGAACIVAAAANAKQQTTVAVKGKVVVSDNTSGQTDGANLFMDYLGETNGTTATASNNIAMDASELKDGSALYVGMTNAAADNKGAGQRVLAVGGWALESIFYPQNYLQQKKPDEQNKDLIIAFCHTIGNGADLKSALENGGNWVLPSDVAVDAAAVNALPALTKDLALFMNGYTLSLDTTGHIPFTVKQEGRLTVSTNVLGKGGFKGYAGTSTNVESKQLVALEGGSCTLYRITVDGIQLRSGNNGSYGIFDIASGETSTLRIVDTAFKNCKTVGANLVSANAGSLSLESCTMEEGNSVNGAYLSAAGGTKMTLKRCTITASGQKAQCLYASGGADVTIDSSTLTGATSAPGYGGMIRVESAGLTLTDTTLQGGSADRGGAIYSNRGTITLKGTTSITGCRASEHGGAIYSKRGRVFLEGSSSITKCTARNGGGIYAYGGRVSMADASEISQCSADYGAGILSGGNPGYFNSNLFMNGGTIRANTAKVAGGGILRVEDPSLLPCVNLAGNCRVFNNLAGEKPAASNLCLVSVDSVYYERELYSVDDGAETDASPCAGEEEEDALCMEENGVKYPVKIASGCTGSVGISVDSALLKGGSYTLAQGTEDDALTFVADLQDYETAYDRATGTIVYRPAGNGMTVVDDDETANGGGGDTPDATDGETSQASANANDGAGASASASGASTGTSAASATASAATGDSAVYLVIAAGIVALLALIGVIVALRKRGR